MCKSGIFVSVRMFRDCSSAEEDLLNTLIKLEQCSI